MTNRNQLVPALAMVHRQRAWCKFLMAFSAVECLRGLGGKTDQWSDLCPLSAFLSFGQAWPALIPSRLLS